MNKNEIKTLRNLVLEWEKCADNSSNDSYYGGVMDCVNDLGDIIDEFDYKVRMPQKQVKFLISIFDFDHPDKGGYFVHSISFIKTANLLLEKGLIEIDPEYLQDKNAKHFLVRLTPKGHADLLDLLFKEGLIEFDPVPGYVPDVNARLLMVQLTPKGHADLLKGKWSISTNGV